MKSVKKVIIITILAFSFMAGKNVKETETRQQKVFNEFWNICDRYYPLMYRKGIDWNKVYNDYNKKITEETTNEELLDLLGDIMKNVLKDGHSYIEYDTEDRAFEVIPNPKVSEMIQNNTESYINYNSTGNKYLDYGVLKENKKIGFINSKIFEPEEETQEELERFEGRVDEALEALKDKEAIIIDVRENRGGQAMYAQYLAGRFFKTEESRLLRRRFKIKKGSDLTSLSDFIEEEEEYFDGYKDKRSEYGKVVELTGEGAIVRNSGDFQFQNKVAVLTSRNTASSGEIFTAAMKTQKHVKTIGNKTFGIFSGSEVFTLKSGRGKWKLKISIDDVEVYYNDKFQSFEGIGITPDKVIIPNEAAITNGKDVHIEEAIHYFNL